MPTKTQKPIQNQTDEKLDRVLEKLDILIFWIKFSNLETAKEHFKKILNTDRKKQIYELTDGRSISEINKALGITSKSTVLDLWTEWATKGILIESSVIKGRKLKAIELKQLGL